MISGDVRFGGKSRRSAVSTLRAGSFVGRTVASTDVNLMPSAGSASTISSVALPMATGAGRRTENRGGRYREPGVRPAPLGRGGPPQAPERQRVDALAEQRQHGG